MMTPGPWWLSEAMDYRIISGRYPHMKDIALAYDKANALAIAAVPELLDALQTARDAIKFLSANRSLNDGECFARDDSLETIHAALKKAGVE